ncbi:MAG: MBOAT family protein [Clostridia bacterium]|nr:MBOAT family protein [Clostridia bacterium]
MLFSSMIFLWVFFSLVIGVNYLFNVIPFRSERARIRTKNLFLLITSLIFYAWGGIYYLLIMVASILLNFAGGYVLEKGVKTQSARRVALVVIVVLNMAILFFFKYFNMLIAIIESLMQSGAGFKEVLNTMISMQGTGALGLAKVVLPIGISFFTFQAMSYVMDIYMGKANLQENIIDFALYVSLFPQLIAGPIVQYADVDLQLRTRKETIDMFVSGQKRFCYGIAKKVLISNTVAKIADDIWALDTQSMGTAVAWLGIIAYTLQIYYDFSGYSDMAIGLGRMLGFNFKGNFDYPYTSLSVSEFWRRWHISLGSWFREYIYIPLGGNRHGLFRTCLNLFIVFALTGIWHGANFTFIAWGLFYAVLQVIERLFLGKLLKKNPVKIINWIYTILAAMLGWVYFRSDNIFQANDYVVQLFNFSEGVSVVSFLSMNAIIVIVVGILFAGFVQRPLKKYYDRVCTKLPVLIADFTLQFVLFFLSILMLVSGTYNPFIYFQF